MEGSVQNSVFTGFRTGRGSKPKAIWNQHRRENPQDGLVRFVGVGCFSPGPPRFTLNQVLLHCFEVIKQLVGKCFWYTVYSPTCIQHLPFHINMAGVGDQVNPLLSQTIVSNQPSPFVEWKSHRSRGPVNYAYTTGQLWQPPQLVNYGICQTGRIDFYKGRVVPQLVNYQTSRPPNDAFRR